MRIKGRAVSHFVLEPALLIKRSKSSLDFPLIDFLINQGLI